MIELQEDCWLILLIDFDYSVQQFKLKSVLSNVYGVPIPIYRDKGNYREVRCDGMSLRVILSPSKYDEAILREIASLRSQ